MIKGGHRLNDKQKKFIYKYYKKYYTPILLEKLNMKFNTNFKYSCIRGFMKRNGLKSNLGHKNHKKGHPIAKVGHERIDKRGYILIKYTNKHKKNWKNYTYKHKYVYEKHYGKIPKGYVIMFKDGNVSNCDINNLILIKRGELSTLTNFNIRIYDEEMYKTAQFINAINKQLKEYKKKKQVI